MSDSFCFLLIDEAAYELKREGRRGGEVIKIQLSSGSLVVNITGAYSVFIALKKKIYSPLLQFKIRYLDIFSGARRI